MVRRHESLRSGRRGWNWQLRSLAPPGGDTGLVGLDAEDTAEARTVDRGAGAAAQRAKLRLAQEARDAFDVARAPLR